ncbi:hypothetical protein C8F01DRAFT_1094749 [Mycena amicta]|nr:hypothetical protein C8F01DRAFT_1094749 [Mycena amicta]
MGGPKETRRLSRLRRVTTTLCERLNSGCSPSLPSSTPLSTRALSTAGYIAPESGTPPTTDFLPSGTGNRRRCSSAPPGLLSAVLSPLPTTPSAAHLAATIPLPSSSSPIYPLHRPPSYSLLMLLNSYPRPIRTLPSKRSLGARNPRDSAGMGGEKEDSVGHFEQGASPSTSLERLYGLLLVPATSLRGRSSPCWIFRHTWLTTNCTLLRPTRALLTLVIDSHPTRHSPATNPGSGAPERASDGKWRKALMECHAIPMGEH